MKTIEHMRGIHVFTDDADIMFERDLPIGLKNRAVVHFLEDGVEITMQKTVEEDRC